MASKSLLTLMADHDQELAKAVAVLKRVGEKKACEFYEYLCEQSELTAGQEGVAAEYVNAIFMFATLGFAAAVIARDK